MKYKIIMVLLITISILIYLYPENKVNINESVYYKKENKERYIKYREKNPELTDEDIYIKVNMNLDKKFYTNTKKAKFLNTNNILVNKYYYLDQNYIPNDLVKLDNCSINGKYLVKEAKLKFDELCNDIKKENLNIRVISSYRSYNYQKVLYDNYVLKDGIKKADTYSARPGFSEHQTGLVIDVDNGKDDFNNFENTSEFKWMINNSYKYGFILRYPYGKENITGYSYEAWHYRYVGDIAKDIFNKDLTLDEYFERYINK